MVGKCRLKITSRGGKHEARVVDEAGNEHELAGVVAVDIEVRPDSLPCSVFRVIEFENDIKDFRSKD